MLVARSYTHASSRRASQERTDKDRASRSKDREPSDRHLWAHAVQQKFDDAEINHALSDPVAVPSPPRSEPSSRPQSRRRSRNRSRNRVKNECHRATDARDSSSTSPSVAAFLAMTTIPPFQKTPKGKTGRVFKQRQMSLSELIEEWHTMDMGDTTPLASSPKMELLLSPPKHDSSLDRRASGAETFQPFPFPSRSQSNESMPSLDSDDISITSSYEPNTPQPSIRSGSWRKEERRSSPSSTDCILDHPLLHNEEDEEEYQPQSFQSQKDIFKPAKPNRLRLQSSISNLRSNLTASFQSLRSAATKFSQLSASTLPPDDYLVRSLFAPSPSVRSEIHPRFFPITATADAGRNLNSRIRTPTRSSFHDFHLHNSYLDNTDLPLLASSSAVGYHPYSTCVIPMKTYERCGDTKPSSTQFSDASIPEATPMVSTPGFKQREPRENSQFLRVCVLEMNMKRQGKLDPNAAFKAQFWLPPRRMDQPQAVTDKSFRLDRKAVPARWRGVATS